MPRDEYGEWHYETSSESRTCTANSGSTAKQDEVSITVRKRRVIRDSSCVREEVVGVSCPYLSQRSLSYRPHTQCGNYVPPSYGDNFSCSCTYDHDLRQAQESG